MARVEREHPSLRGCLGVWLSGCRYWGSEQPTNSCTGIDACDRDTCPEPSGTSRAAPNPKQIQQIMFRHNFERKFSLFSPNPGAWCVPATPVAVPAAAPSMQHHPPRDAVIWDSPINADIFFSGLMKPAAGNYFNLGRNTASSGSANL